MQIEKIVRYANIVKGIVIICFDFDVVFFQPPVNELRNGRIKGYYVGYKLYNSSELHLYKTVEAKAMKNSGQLGECMLHNLRKFTKYSILVQAYNSIGAGPRSDEMVVSTAEDGK